ncbi:MAG: hypothetical protein H0W72_04905 [Planctomycetes bacterium]|nr:hypothetical protein [Planctomycetota bacterium]
MLNLPLIEEFLAIARERRTGSLALAYPGDRKLRYCFQDGELVLLDFGEDKELAMARKFLEYHKIGPEIHRHAIASVRATGASIVETLRRQQLVNDSEVQQIARTLVEDMLVLCFGTTHLELGFNPDQVQDTYDLESRAVRLKIDTTTLLRTVEGKVKDEEANFRDVGGWAAVYALAEPPDGAQLDDFERHVLNFVDGRKTVEDVAIAFRDSNSNIAKVLVRIERKGFIRKAVPTLPAKRPVATSDEAPGTTPAASAQAGAPIAPAASGEFKMYVSAPQEVSRLGPRLLLLAVLAVMVGVGFYVVSFSKKQQRLNDIKRVVDEHIGARHWADARTSLDAAKAAQTGDLTSKREVEDLERRLSQALTAEVAIIGTRVDSQDYAEARERLDDLPEGLAPAALRERLDSEERSFTEVSGALARRVADALERADVAMALKTVDAATGKTGRQAQSVLERWRIALIEQARQHGTPLGERQAIINKLAAARPTSYQQEQIKLLQEELLRGQNRRQEQLRQVRQLTEQGAFREAQSEIDAQKLFEQAPGSPLADEATKVEALLRTVRGALESAVSGALSAVREGGDQAALDAARNRIVEVTKAYPQASNREQLAVLGEQLGQLRDVVGKGMVDDEVVALNRYVSEQTLLPEVDAAIAGRIERLKGQDSVAQNALEAARRYGREGRWDEAIAALQTLAKRTDLKRTASLRTVQDELTQARASKSRQEALQERIHVALASGDVETAHATARELGLRYLPVLVESIPSGAEVFRDDKRIGKTPLVLEINAGERAELTTDLRLAGYEPLTVRGSQASGGWRMTGVLRRTARARADLAGVLTARPAAAGGRLWVANNTWVAAIDVSGKVAKQTFELGASPALARTLEQPVYAPACELDDGVYIATREPFALRIREGVASRVALPSGTDFALASWRSPLVLDRRYLVVAGIDGAVHATDPRDPSARWAGRPGARFAAGPVVVGESVLVARSDGRLESYQVDRGTKLAGIAVDSPIVAAWPIAGGIAGYSATTAWRWDGKLLQSENLPRTPVAAGDGILVTGDRQVFLRNGDGWSMVGQHQGTLSGAPLAWRGHAVLPCGPLLQVIGPAGFVVQGKGQFLTPLAIGDDLAAATSTGEVVILPP